MDLFPTSTEPRLYRELAAWWPLLSVPADYAEEAAFYGDALARACVTPPRTVLELGCGGGNNASHLKARFAMTLVDRSADMLAVSRALNPECAHAVGDMRDARLGQTFDAVFVHDAVAYLTTEAELRAAFATAYVHCRHGGAALFAPDFVRETFHSDTRHGGHDAAERGLRYLEWTWDPDPSDVTYVADYAYLLRDQHGTRCEQDRHVLGLFSRDQWVRLLAEAGFEPHAISFHHDAVADRALEAFVGVKTLRASAY